MLFDFTFNPYSLLSLLTVAINSALLYLIVSRGIQSPVKRWFSFVLISLIVWGFFEFLDRSANNPTASNFWAVAGMLGWGFVGPLFTVFTLNYVRKAGFLNSLFNQILLFSPAILFLLVGLTTDLINNTSVADTSLTFYGWEAKSGQLFWLVVLWLDALFISSIGLLLRHLLAEKNPINKKQTAFFIIAVSIPIVGGSITNGLLPVLGIQFYPAATLLTSIMSLIITFAILKYKLFDFDPALAITNIVETMNEILMVFSLGGTIQFLNPAVERILGYRKKELLESNAKILFKESWQDFEQKVLKKILLEKNVSGLDFDLVAKNGSKIPITLSASVLQDSDRKASGVVAVASDISKLRNFVMEISAERNKLTTTLDSIVDGVLVLDFSGKVTMVNPAGLSMLSMRREDILGKSIDDLLEMFEGEKMLKVKNLMAKTKVDHDMIVFQRPNIRIVIKKDKQIYVNLTSSAIKESIEAGIGAILTMTNVSKEKELEEMKIDFVSMAAHELRTPLTAIRGYLSVLQEETGKVLNKEQNSFLEKAFVSSSQLAALVENLLSVSKIERGAMKLEADEVNWKEVLTECYNNFKSLADEREIKLKLNLPTKLDKVFVDRFRITEVISNLVANAINYTKPGGRVEISAKNGKNEVTTTVKDTGQGIPGDAIPKLFTKFFRVSGVLEQGSKGTGLGLYISKAIVDMHKGKIWVESKLGKGTTFYFTVSSIKAKDKFKPAPAKEKTIETKDLMVPVAKKVPEYQASENFPRSGKRFFKRKP